LLFDCAATPRGRSLNKLFAMTESDRLSAQDGKAAAQDKNLKPKGQRPKTKDRRPNTKGQNKPDYHNFAYNLDALE
jgi:hypothetical protein